MSETRPEVSAGPIERSFSPESKPGVNLELSGGAAGRLLVVFDCALAMVDAKRRRVSARVRMRGIG